MKIKDIENQLFSYGVDDPKNEALLIVERLFNVNRASLVFCKDRDFNSSELDTVLQKRKEHIPLQYIFGEWEFMGKEFYVSPDCLIPRPDTEILVERAINDLKTGDRVADLCTGSGCIGLSLLIHRKDIECATLMDISLPALKMAELNCNRHNLGERCSLVLGDITEDFKGEYDMIVSNPPYIPTKDIEYLSREVKKEPRLALDGGEDGLDIIRYLIGEGLDHLKDDGEMLIEFGFDQGQIMDTLLGKIKNEGKIKDYEILFDYGGNPRVAVIKK